jgi:hypothetical protein
MRCCATCIGDYHLRKEVFPRLSSETGRCRYCGSEDVALVAPAELRDYFELVVGIYVRDETGHSLVHWLMNDWGMFDHRAMDAAHAKELLADILDDGEIVSYSFAPTDSDDSEVLHRWEAFRQELMHENRYFPRSAPEPERLRGLLSQLRAREAEIPATLFRARLQEGKLPYTAQDMGAPPADVAIHGRANPAGIRYLYAASDRHTAISELRPHTGDIAWVAEVSAWQEAKDVKLADLRNPRKTISPFVFQDGAQVAELRRDLPFLIRLGEELTCPVRQKSAHIDYLPSQYLCEFIKHCGFDGVMYRSSVGTGVNVALFDPDKARIVGLQRQTVLRVNVELAGDPATGAGVPIGA